ESDGLRLLRRDLRGKRLQRLRRWRAQHCSFGGSSLVDAEAQFCRRESGGLLKEKVVKLRAMLTTNLNGIFKSFGRYKSNARAFTLEQRVGADSSAVQHNDLLRGGGDLAHGIGNRLGRIGRRGKYFQDLEGRIL